MEIALILVMIVIIIFVLIERRNRILITKANERLLLKILPYKVAEQLKAGQETIVSEEEASVLFIDIVKFTEMTFKLGSKETVRVLGGLFDMFDDLTVTYGVEKIKTIGDSYMVVSGLPEASADHPIRLADFALAAREDVQIFNKKNQMNLQVRMGMACGKVVAGVIGHKKYVYDTWGDVVNVASRMESTGVPGEIQLSESIEQLLAEKFICEPRSEEINVKGKGIMKTYFLRGRREA
ncbi:MAG: adenylate/guanylate cyclase domain-containing protein [Gammaproteobacteria bacterium]|jgi:class 3 adenylate cyclase